MSGRLLRCFLRGWGGLVVEGGGGGGGGGWYMEEGDG